MIVKAITNPNLFKVLDEGTNKTFYGCDQEWYTTEWQRISGCGPSAASNLICYLNHKRSNLTLDQIANNKETCLHLMEEIWEYVTPTKDGIDTTKMFYEAVITYTKSKDINVEFKFCDFPEEKSERPKLSDIIKFLEGGLSKDVPIAFLNLSSGEEKNLQEWHWVTIISLEYSEDEDGAFINILDEGFIKRIDLALWNDTTIFGGGFVYFTFSPDLIEKL